MLHLKKVCYKVYLCENRERQSCGFAARSKSVPAIKADAIQFRYLKLNSYKQTSSE